VQARAPDEGEQGALCVVYMNGKNETNAMHYHYVRTGTEKMATALRTKEGNSFRVGLVPFSVFLVRLPPARLPPARLSACIVSLFGCMHIQSQAREIRRLVACTR
jgi:hypothetical protein